MDLKKMKSDRNDPGTPVCRRRDETQTGLYRCWTTDHLDYKGKRENWAWQLWSSTDAGKRVHGLTSTLDHCLAGRNQFTQGTNTPVLTPSKDIKSTSSHIYNLKSLKDLFGPSGPTRATRCQVTRLDRSSILEPADVWICDCSHLLNVDRCSSHCWHSNDTVCNYWPYLLSTGVTVAAGLV